MNKAGFFVNALVISLIVGFIAGIAGEFFSRYYLTNVALFQDLYLPSQGQIGEKQVIIQEAKNVVVEEDRESARLLIKQADRFFLST